MASGWGHIGTPLDRIEDVQQDHAWLNLLPEGSTPISATGYGGSYWSDTGKIDVRLKDGSTDTYFIKISKGPTGKKMAIGEYESMKALHSSAPALVPRQIGCGTFESDPDSHFLLCEFMELYEEMPDVVDLAQEIASLHRRSMKLSDGRFGFHVPTCNETVEQHTAWSTSWEAFFTESLRMAFELEEEVHGVEPEILELQHAIFEKVCPRLLRPLETEGRTLRPALVHGDLWDGNIAVHAKTGRPIIFDASSVWAHNEYEMHIWRGSRYKIGKEVMKEYFHHIPISPPEDDWYDRNLLYSLIADLHSSTHFRHTERFRDLLLQSMRDLVSKYPNGYTGTASRKDLAKEKRTRSPAKPVYKSLGEYSNQ